MCTRAVPPMQSLVQTRVSGALTMRTGTSAAVHTRRDVDRVKEEWFTDMEGLKERVGMVDALPTEDVPATRSRSKMVRGVGA